jgi:hypothetical protein
MVLEGLGHYGQADHMMGNEQIKQSAVPASSRQNSRSKKFD